MIRGLGFVEDAVGFLMDSFVQKSGILIAEVKGWGLTFFAPNIYTIYFWKLYC